MRTLSIIAVLWLSGNAALAAEPIVGRASVLDGDTLEIAGVRIGLYGIAAPDGTQVCTTGGRQWLCGQRAALALDVKIAGAIVSCDPKRGDRYGRILAVCRVRGEALNAWMVSQGWALAFRIQSTDYVNHQREAARNKRGLWQSDFAAPWQWRQRTISVKAPAGSIAPRPPSKIGPPIRLTPP